jgi:dienelactone hydrolase
MIRNRVAVATPVVLNFFKALKENEAADLPVGTAGYCWGGKYVFMLCGDSEKASNGKSLVDCGFTAHPSNLVIPADAEPIKLPLSVAIGDKDFALKNELVNQMQGIFEKKKEVETEVVVIPGAPHGFAVRCSPTDEKAVEQAEQAFEQAVAWFDKFLVKAKN